MYIHQEILGFIKLPFGFSIFYLCNVESRVHLHNSFYEDKIIFMNGDF